MVSVIESFPSIIICLSNGIFKVGLSGRGDLIVFKYFTVFSLKSRLANFCVHLIFVFSKKESQSCQFFTY